MRAHTGTAVAQVHHICCIPDGPANAIEPTMIGNHSGDMACAGKYPNWNMPVTVLVRSLHVPTIAATTAVLTTSSPMRMDSRFSSRL